MMRISRPWRWTLLAASALLLLAVGVANTPCGVSSTLPPKPSAAQLDILRTTHFAATLAVEPYQYPVYSESLASDLRKTGLFDAVGISQSMQHADLVARVEQPVHGSSRIPVLALATLGVIPSTTDEELGYVFSVRSTSGPSPPVLIDFRYRGSTTLGCVAHVMNLSSERTDGNPEETARFREALAIAIAVQRSSIAKLLQRP